MEAYRHNSTDSFCAVIFKNKKTGKIGLVHNIHNEQHVRDWWRNNEKNYEILEIKEITNISALKYFVYYDNYPVAYNTQEQRLKKFDFFKYVLGADLSEKYRGVSNVSEIED